MTDPVKLLSDDEVAEIEAWKTNSYGSMVNLPIAKRDALCQTVRALESALRKANEIVEEAAFENRKLQLQLAQVTQERDEALRILHAVNLQ